MVGTILINEEVLGSTLLSTSMDDKIKGFLNRIIEDHKESEQTIKDVLDRALTLERRDTYVKKVQHVLSDTFYKKACSLNLGASVADAALEEIKKNPLYDTFSFMISDNAIEGMKGKIQEMVDDMVFDKGEEMITTVVERESEGLLNLTIAELYERFEYQLPRVEDFVLEAYHSLVSSSLSKILKAVDIAKLVEDRINGFDVLELEHIILGIMKASILRLLFLFVTRSHDTTLAHGNGLHGVGIDTKASVFIFNKIDFCTSIFFKPEKNLVAIFTVIDRLPNFLWSGHIAIMGKNQ